MPDLIACSRRRQQLMETIGDDAVAVFRSPPETLRNGDVQDPFRQTSDILYLTGFAEPGTTLILRPGAEKEKVVMFVRPRDKALETWNGRRAGTAGVVSTYAADAAYAADELEAKLPELIANADDLYYSLGDDPAFDQQIGQVLTGLRRTERRGKRPPTRVVDPREVLHEMRLIKQPEEIEVLRRAATITAEAHIAAMQLASPGVYEHEVEAVVDYTFRRRGGAGPGYPSIVGGGDNATILHYVENKDELRDGELLLIDAGCEYDFYTADVTRTFPVGGTFGSAQKRVYEVVLRAQVAGIAASKPGATIDGIHNQCVRVLTEGMIELGLLSGTADERITDESYKKFYMHRTSHWLGMDVHDVGAYLRDGEPRPLAEGMVITVEPGLYIAADEEEAPEEFRGIGVRIEDDILITADGCENLTAAIPKTIAEVEAACAQD